MMTKKLILPVLMMSACTSASFGSKGSRKAAAAVDPQNSPYAGQQAPLDVSTANTSQGINGPLAGTGREDATALTLDCNSSQGIEVVVSSDGTATPVSSLFLGDPTSTTPVTKDDSAPAGKGDDPVVTVDKDGNPIGKDGNPVSKDGDDGKGDGPKGDEPLPPAPPVVVTPTSKVVTTVKGQFCPKAQNALTVLFVVDFSGSMGLHRDGGNSVPVPGNDPQINGTCGRLQAAQAVMAQIAASKAATDNIQIAFVPFAGGIVTNKVIGLTDFDSFNALVTKDTFCQYVVQHVSDGLDPQNPGGIDGSISGVSAATNYQAAFTAADSLLSSVYGRKQVFFISDGEPTVPGNGATASNQSVNASVAAGAALRNDVDNLTLSAVLLNNAEIGTTAQSILTQVAGSADQVRTAADASQLASQILQFPDASIDVTSGDATLTVAPYPRADLGLQFLQADATAGVWDYQTQPFVLLGVPGQDVLNVVQVTAKGTDGTLYSAIVKIHYKQ